MRRTLRSQRADLIGILAIVALTVLTAVAGSVSGDFTSAWYRALRKPPWQPSGRVIGAVWTVLYTFTAVSGSLLWRDRDRRAARRLGWLFGVQYGLNLAFTPLFTRGRALTAATVDCALLTATVAALLVRAWPVSRAAALLLAPYALWGAFATVLSWRLRQLNRGKVLG